MHQQALVSNLIPIVSLQENSNLSLKTESLGSPFDTSSKIAQKYCNKIEEM